MDLSNLRDLFRQVGAEKKVVYMYFNSRAEAQGRRLYLYRRKSDLKKALQDGRLQPSTDDLDVILNGGAFCGDSAEMTIEEKRDGITWGNEKPFRLVIGYNPYKDIEVV